MAFVYPEGRADHVWSAKEACEQEEKEAFMGGGPHLREGEAGRGGLAGSARVEGPWRKRKGVDAEVQCATGWKEGRGQRGPFPEGASYQQARAGRNLSGNCIQLASGTP